MDQGKTLIFFHIGRTGGTTLNMIFKRQFQQENICDLNGALSPQCVNEFKSLSRKRRAQIRYLHAHEIPFGVHEVLPQRPVYFTLLRNPVERVISRYFHFLRRPEDAIRCGVKGLSLQEFATGNVLLGDTQSGQTRAISGVRGEDWIASPEPLSHDILEVAKANLRQHFTVVGLTERFDESLILLKRAIGWRTRDILYVKQQVGRNRPANDDIGSEITRLIENHNELDIKLYEFAKQMFEEQISQQGSSFRRELQIFRLCNIFNTMYSRLMSTRLQKAVDLLPALIRGDITISYIYHRVLNKIKAIIRNRNRSSNRGCNE